MSTKTSTARSGRGNPAPALPPPLHPMYSIRAVDDATTAGLLLYLRRSPTPDETSVRALVEKGRLRLDLTVQPLSGTTPLFLDGTVVQLRERGGAVWSERTLTGTEATAKFDLLLSAENCAVAHGSLRGGTELAVCTELRYRNAGEQLFRQSSTVNLCDIPGVPTRVQLRYFDPSTESYLTVPPNQLLADRAARRGPAEKPALLLTSAGLQSTAAFLKPAGTASAAQLIATIRPTTAPINKLVLLETVFPNRLDPKKSLPVLDSLSAAIWKDSTNKHLRWYLPIFTLLRPTAGLSPADSPFIFRFQREGTGLDGTPVLSGQIRLVLRREQTASTQEAVAALEDQVDTREIPLLNTTYRLRLPYTDEVTGEGRHTDLLPQDTVLQADGSIRLQFVLKNQWIKAAYGAFAIDRYQAAPPALLVDYTFLGYRNERIQQYQLAAGTKVSRVAGRKGDATYPTPVIIDPATRTVYGPQGAYQSGPPPARAQVTARPLQLAPLAAPQLNNRLTVGTTASLNQELFDKVSKLVERSVGRSQQIEFTLPCAEFAAYYLERLTATASDTVIGCREPYALGTISPSYYTELPDLRDPEYRVLASNQSPGRYLVMPTRYAIGRKWDEAAQLCRPAALFHVAVDATDGGTTIGRFDAYLEPDISVRKLHGLQAVLAKNYAPLPILDFPTGVEGELTCAFSEPTVGENALTCVESGVGFSFGIRLALADLLIFTRRLETGLVTGNSVLQLPDGKRYSSELGIDPGHLTGPWLEGPTKLTVRDGTTELKNQVTNPVSVSEIHWTDNSGTPVITSVARDLTPGETLPLPELPVDRLAEATAVVTEHFLPAGTRIEQTNIYLDDIDQQIALMPTYDLAAEGVVRIQVEARLDPDAEIRTGQLLPGENLLEVFLRVPFLHYLSSHHIQYRLTTYFAQAGAAPVESPWLTATIGELLLIPKQS